MMKKSKELVCQTMRKVHMLFLNSIMLLFTGQKCTELRIS